MFNKVILMGRLCNDPEFRQTQTGIPMTTFTVAIDRPSSRNSTERVADFFRVLSWRSAAEFAAKYFQKGSMVIVEGKIQNNNYTDQQGVKHYSFDIIADSLQFGETRAAAEARGQVIKNPGVGGAGGAGFQGGYNNGGGGYQGGNGGYNNNSGGGYQGGNGGYNSGGGYGGNFGGGGGYGNGGQGGGYNPGGFDGGGVGGGLGNDGIGGTGGYQSKPPSNIRGGDGLGYSGYNQGTAETAQPAAAPKTAAADTNSVSNGSIEDFDEIISDGDVPF